MERIWKPTERQKDFISLPDTVFEGMYGGAAGGGKSECLLMLPIVREFYKHPRFKGILFRRTYPELERELILRSQEYLRDTGGRYNDAKKRWSWPNGGIFQFGYAEHEKDVRNYDTAEYNYLGFDELTSFTEFQYMYLAMSRCRSSTDNLPAIVRSGTNPGNVGHGFVRKRFVEPHPNGYVIIQERRKISGVEATLKRIFIPSRAQDNTYLMQADPNYVNRLNLLPEAEKAAKLYGDWWTFEGQVFDEWRVQPFSDEPTNAQHVIPAFRIPEYWPRILSIDWGYSAMTCAGWYAINPETKRIYKYREYVCTKTRISSWATDVARLSHGENILDVVLDPSAWGHRGDEFTIQEQFALSSGMQPRSADNDRVGGKILLQELLRWKPRPPRFIPKEGFDPDVGARILRLNGDKAYNNYISLFIPEELEKNLPRFQIFENCEQTINCIPLCVYDKVKKEDVAEFDGDDPYDETRYGLKACQSYLEVGESEYKRASEIAKVCSDLERTKNQTNFYMQMDRIDKTQSVSHGVRRYHAPKSRRFVR